MNLLTSLEKTYDRAKLLGYELTPICHMPQNSHITVVIDINGNFKRAFIEKKTIILPVTEASSTRSSDISPHPLCDKVKYVAKDYLYYGKEGDKYYKSYEEQLGGWCNSLYSHPKAIAVYNYIKKGNVISDLINTKILFADDYNKLLVSWPENQREEEPEIFKILPPVSAKKRINKNIAEIDQGSALISWAVEIPGELNCNTWEDKTLQDNWIEYDYKTNSVLGFCHISGKEVRIALNHPKRIRNAGDNARLISSNDLKGYTFRGLFTDGSQAATVGHEVSQKAHNILRWLIEKNGFKNEDQVYVSWAISSKKIPSLLSSSYDLFNDGLEAEETEEELEPDIDHSVDLGTSFAKKMKKYLAGYSVKLDPNEQIIILGLDSAIPGRLAIIYYQSLLASDFLQKIENWHTQFAWYQRRTTENNKKQKKTTIWPISSPSPRAIIKAAYGDTVENNKTLKKSTIKRIMPCIVDDRQFPKDIIDLTVRRASNPNACDHWEWEQNIGIACALYKGYYLRNKKQRRIYKVGLETNRTTRDYLYGRLLATADQIENCVLYKTKQNRKTTAQRMMQQFSKKPFSTWKTIELELQPYAQKLKTISPGFSIVMERQLNSIMSNFNVEEFLNNEPLTGEFLLGYHCQKQDNHKKEEVVKEEE